MPPSDPSPSDSAPRASHHATIPWSLHAGAILALIGLLASALLFGQHVGIRAFLCPAEGGCETVLASKFAALRGIPLSVLGLAFYALVLAILLTVYAIREKAWRLRLVDGVLWMTVVGATFSAGLMYVQFRVLHAFCPLCTLSAGVMVALVVAMIRANRALTTAEWGASPAGAVTLAVFAVLPVGLLLASGLAPSDAAARRQWIDLSTAQLTGRRDARVQVVVFSDFECQFCRQLAPALKQIREEFPQDVLMAFRAFPLESHPRAFPAAVAAECAAEQDAFWPYHDRLFADGGAMDDAQLLALATSLGLNQERFAQCLQSSAPQKRVAASRDDAIRAGLEGVPAVFVNGQRMRGPLDYDHLVREIREWLPQPPAGGERSLPAAR